MPNEKRVEKYNLAGAAQESAACEDKAGVQRAIKAPSSPEVGGHSVCEFYANNVRS